MISEYIWGSPELYSLAIMAYSRTEFLGIMYLADLQVGAWRKHITINSALAPEEGFRAGCHAVTFV